MSRYWERSICRPWLVPDAKQARQHREGDNNMAGEEMEAVASVSTIVRRAVL
jgi:hypothetical protein